MPLESLGMLILYADELRVISTSLPLPLIPIAHYSDFYEIELILKLNR